jgi:hypothetical protein
LERKAQVWLKIQNKWLKIIFIRMVLIMGEDKYIEVKEENSKKYLKNGVKLIRIYKKDNTNEQTYVFDKQSYLDFVSEYLK